MRKPPKINKTAILLAALGAVFVVALVLYLAVLQPWIDATEPEDNPHVTPEEGEGTGVLDTTLLMFPRVERAQVASLFVANRYDPVSGTYDTYKFVKDVDDANGDGDRNDFLIENDPIHTCDATKFASLIVDAGYTACLGKLDELDFTGLDDAAADAIYAAYGLDPASHPVYYTLEKTDGTVYTVRIGDKTTDGNYYAALDGRRAVYVLYAALDQSVLAPLTYFVNPALTFEGESDYAYVYCRNFTIFRNPSVVDLFFGAGEPGEDPAVTGIEPFVMFTFLPSTERDVFHSSSVYAMLAPSAAYTANETAVDKSLALLPGLTGSEVLKIGLDDADFAPGGLLENVACTVYYEMPYGITYDANNDPIVRYWMKNVLFVSPRQADGNYIVGSLFYGQNPDGTDAALFRNMIARVAYEDLFFVEADLTEWAQDQIVGTSIDNVSSFSLRAGDAAYTFDIEGDGSTNQTVTERNSGYRWAYKGRRQPFEVNAQGYCDDIAQFRQFYMLLVLLDYEGSIAEDSGLDEEAIAAVMADDSNCILDMTLTLEDGRVFRYRFYPYTERHAMVSVSGGGAPEITCFYTLNSAVRRLSTAAWQLLNGVEINYEDRY